MYKSKKNDEPVVVLPYDVFVSDIYDDAIKGDEKYTANRSMRVLELAKDGSHVKLWISMAMDITNDTLWHPKSLFKTVTEVVGHPQPVSLVGGADKKLISDCMGASWERTGEWTSDAMHHLIENEDFDVIFSHFHNVDLQSHMIAKYLKNGHKDMAGEEYQKMLEEVYLQTDRYISRYLDLLDKGWTVLVVSDHGLVCPEHEVPLICDSSGVNVGVMNELGFTEVKRDAEGKPLKEIDWPKTKAVQVRCNHIWINLKGRNPEGIVEPEDQYELEEEIITALYGYKDKTTGKRIISLALRNKDAYLLGMGGPECGDILIWLAEGYNYDHGESLSTTYGHATTSTSPIFLGAGTGLKKGFYTDRIIRQVDITPTIAALLGIRMPNQSEGSVVHQILAQQY